MKLNLTVFYKFMIAILTVTIETHTYSLLIFWRLLTEAIISKQVKGHRPNHCDDIQE